MSNSTAHDILIKPVEAYMRQSLACTHVVVEPGRPNRYTRGREWPSVDVYGMVNNAHNAVTVDIKISMADSRAQLEKPYVVDPRLNVGRVRYIAAPAGVAVVVPDGYGLLVVGLDGGVSEASEPIPAKPWGRNWEAECCYAELCWRGRVIDEQGAATDRGIHAKRGLATEAAKVLADAGYPMTAAQIGKELGKKRQDVARACDACGDIEFDRLAVPRLYSLAETKERVSA